MEDKDRQLIYYPKANDGKGGYTEFATNNYKKIGDELQKTDKGKEQFNKLVNSEQPTEIVLVDGKHKGTNGKEDAAVAGTISGDANGNIPTSENAGKVVDVDMKAIKSTIKVYVGQVDEMLVDDKKGEPHGLYGKSVEGFSFIQIIAAAVGHEIEHGTKENTIKRANCGLEAAEVVPTEVSNTIIDQINTLKKK